MNIPATAISMVAVPLLPNASVTEQVWFPESIEWNESWVSVEELP